MRQVALLLVLAACPAKQGPQPPPPQTGPQAGVGCPRASDVYMAQYIGPQGQGSTGWTLPLHDVTVDSVAHLPPFAAIDRAAAAAAGVPAAPAAVWLLPSNGPLCKATVGGYYAAAIDAETKNVSYGVTLTGCPAPGQNDDSVGIAMVSVEPPNQCQLVPPGLAAARLGDTTPQNVWVRPTKETPMPPQFAALVPDRACGAPDCEKLWSVGRVDVAGKPVAWSGAVNWVEIPQGSPPSAQCTWRVDTFSALYVEGPAGQGSVKLDEARHPLVLALVLADQKGAKVLLADGVGEYATWDYGDGRPTLGHHVTWFLDDAAAYGTADHLGPRCPVANQP